MPTILSNQEVTLVVAGEFWQDKQKYLAIIDDLKIAGAVKIVDAYIPNEAISTYFSAADLVVQPYRSVSGSGVCQIAYGLGRPVVATNVGCLAEVVNDRENGRIVDPEDPEEIASAVLESLVPETLKKYKKNAAYTLHFAYCFNYLNFLIKFLELFCTKNYIPQKFNNLYFDMRNVWNKKINVDWVVPVVDYIKNNKFPWWMTALKSCDLTFRKGYWKLPFSHLFYVIGKK